MVQVAYQCQYLFRRRFRHRPRYTSGPVLLVVPLHRHGRQRNGGGNFFADNLAEGGCLLFACSPDFIGVRQQIQTENLPPGGIFREKRQKIPYPHPELFR